MGGAPEPLGNDTGRDAQTIVEALLQRAAAAPDFAALHLHIGDGVHSYTRRELVEQSLEWTRAYRALGLRPGDLVIVMIEFGPAMPLAYLGALLGGFVPSYMPYSTAKQDREQFIRSHRRLFERTNAKVVATNSSWLRSNAAIFENSPVVALIAETVGAEGLTPALEPPYQAAPEDVALLQHSSGTTALKKGVALSHRAVLNQARSYAAAIGLTETDTIASWLPLYHDMGLMACFLIPAVMGTPVAQMDPFLWAREPWRLFLMIAERRATLVWLPNFAYHHLARTVDPASPYDLSPVRAFIACSEPCKPATMRAFIESFGAWGVRPEALHACYAMAENGFAVTQTWLGGQARYLRADADGISSDRRYSEAAPGRGVQELMSTGRPIEGVQVSIVDETRAPVAEGMVGEIAVAGESLFSGYFRLQQETDAAFQGGWYYTGDLGFLKDQELYITGRKKDLIIVRGRNFYAHDIEFAVSEVEGLKPGRSVAFGVFREASGTEEAIVVAEAEQFDRLAPEDVRGRSMKVKERVKAALDLELFSVKLVEPGWLVKTTSGKVSRSENKQKYLDQSRDPNVGPSGETTPLMNQGLLS